MLPYEYLLKEFADSAGKKGGEFYTPTHVKKQMVRLVQPREGMTVYDPTVGSGGFLIESRPYIEEQGQDSRNLALYGQELNGSPAEVMNSSSSRDYLLCPFHVFTDLLAHSRRRDIQ